MRLFHRSRKGDTILTEGFRDGRGAYLTSHEYAGVWLSDRPLTANEGARGDDLLVVEMPEELLAEWEWVGEGKWYREFLVPASVVNAYPVRRARDDEDESS